MKKINKLIFILILLVIGIINVNAKDTVYSINKYKESKFSFIEKAYNEKLKEDGYLLGGTFLKERENEDEEEAFDSQVIIVKYNKHDQISWKYTYGEENDDYLNCLTYSYDDEENINGYLLVVSNKIIKVDLEGKLIEEKEINEGNISKIIPTYENNLVNGYISIVNNSLIKYSINFEVIWRRDFEELKDLTLIKENESIIGYSIIKGNELIKLDSNGNNDIVLDDISKYYTSHLEESSDGFILYGLTDEVKLKNSDYSYYLINYKSNLEKEEIIGDTPINEEYNIRVLLKDKEIFILYKNDSDKSYEIIKIDKDSLEKTKVKKINNNYYDFENFYTNGKTIYLIGQINCPEDEKCEYDNRSLYLVSDEDKVIEVKETESTGIIIVICALFILTGLYIFIRRKRKMSKRM